MTHSKPGPACCCASATTALKDHDLVAGLDPASLHNVHIEKRPVRDFTGRVVEGLHATWIVLDNENAAPGLRGREVCGRIHAKVLAAAL